MKSLPPIIILCLLFFISLSGHAQTDSTKVLRKDSLQTKKDTVSALKDSTDYKDSVRIDKLMQTAERPIIKNSKWSGAIPVSGIDEKPDPKMKYKLLIEITWWEKDSAKLREISSSLAEVGRIINLHAAAGIDKKNIETVIVAHAGVLNAFLTNEKYQKKFHTDNPNLDIIKQLEKNNVKIIACGQAMHFANIPKEDLLPVVKVAISAKVALSTYISKGYVLYTN
ncbi:MAG: DsrE family protein [Chitinophagaceae bacterium]|nr:DsrE family protein [Chitinophagaceae bacterium]